jgi:hypothetical protein
MISRLSALLFFVTLSVTASAQDSKPDFGELAKDHVYEIERSGPAEFNGDGWDRLINTASKVDFFLIGEQHAVRDIAQFELALHASLAPHGFDHMVVEVGPWSTRHAEALLRSGERDPLGQFIAAEGNRFTLPFLFFREEIDLVEQAIKLSPHSRQVLWGVDQEFLGAGPILLEKLLAMANTDVHRAAIDKLEKGIGSNFMYLGAAPEEDILALEMAFADGPDDARALVEAIKITHRIYGPFVRSTGPIYPANLERENYMKDNFLSHFRSAEQRLGDAPKAIFKFGGFHMERGLSGTNVPSFGNFVLEWGHSRGFNSTNLLVDCNGGEAYAIMSGGPAPCKSYALNEGSPLLNAIGDRSIALIDLAALRPSLSRHKDLDTKTRDLVLSYDFYVAIRDVTPQTPVADLTFPSD